MAMAMDKRLESPVQRTARRHSLLVKILRFMLPATGVLILVGMVGTIVLFNMLSNLGISNISLSMDGLVMDHPELSGHDGDRSYKVKAVRAIQRLSDPRIIDLETIQASIGLSATQKADIVATKGIYNSAEETLKLFEGLQVEWSEGYTVDMSEVFVDMKTGALDTSSPITIYSENGSIRSKKFDYDQEAGIAIFKEDVRMVITPKNDEE
ncbi:MAG: LPS export ABC transporter periplasmic protein LptC [Rhodobacteraceae bacterium]|nr:LPS export ABC transporter periplasmic protein LptC [Paracoccaceae bacterium]